MEGVGWFAGGWAPEVRISSDAPYYSPEREGERISRAEEPGRLQSMGSQRGDVTERLTLALSCT